MSLWGGILADDMKVGGYRGILPKGYVLKKWLIWLGFLPSLLFLGYMLMVEGTGEKWFIECPDSALQCKNPFYSQCNEFNSQCANEKLRAVACAENPYLCSLQFLPSGFTAGEPPGELYGNFFSITAGFPLFMLVLNHVLFNWRRKDEGNKNKSGHKRRGKRFEKGV